MHQTNPLHEVSTTGVGLAGCPCPPCRNLLVRIFDPLGQGENLGGNLKFLRDVLAGIENLCGTFWAHGIGPTFGGNIRGAVRVLFCVRLSDVLSSKRITKPHSEPIQTLPTNPNRTWNNRNRTQSVLRQTCFLSLTVGLTRETL